MGRTGLRIAGQDESGLLRLAPMPRSEARELADWMAGILVVVAAAVVGMALSGLKWALRVLVPHVPPPPEWLTQIGRHPAVVVPGVVLGAASLVLLVAISGMQARVAAAAAKDKAAHTEEPVFIGDGRFLDEEDDEGEGYPYDPDFD